MNEEKINNFLELKKHYIQNPYLFVEELLGVKLSLYQRMMLRVMNRYQAKKPIYSSRKLEYYLRALQRLVSLEEDSKVAFYDGDGHKEMIRDEAVEFILRKLNYRF